MLRFGWTIPISKIQNRNENLSNYKELVKKFKGKQIVGRLQQKKKKHPGLKPRPESNSLEFNQAKTTRIPSSS